MCFLIIIQNHLGFIMIGVRDIGFIKFFKDENISFITIEDYVLEALVILSNIE